MGTRENKFQSSENLCKHRENITISFISPVLSSVSYEVQHSFTTSVVARNDFFRRYLKQSYRSLQYDVNIFVHLILELLVDSVIKFLSNWFGIYPAVYNELSVVKLPRNQSNNQAMASVNK